MRRAVSVVVILTMVVTLGCASSGENQKKGTKLGAIIGGLLGAATVLATGGDAKDALQRAAIGAAAGAAIGAAVGAAKDRKLAERNAAIEQYAYNASKGDLLKIERMTLSNTSPSPGDEIVVTIQYTAISPKENKTITVYGVPYIKTGDDVIKLSRFKSKVPNGGGTMEVAVPVTLGSKMPKGTYQLEADMSVRASRASDRSQTKFYVS